MSEEKEQVFVSLVETSWHRYEEHMRNGQMDDLLVGAVITAMVETGYALIDLESDGISHYLRFENLDTKQRIIFRLQNKTENIIAAKVLGRYAEVIIGYGQTVQKIGQVWKVFQDEMKSTRLNAQEPGVITFDADLATGYIYAQVPLLLELDQYFGDGYHVDYKLIQTHIEAAVHSLAKYLNGRIATKEGK